MQDLWPEAPTPVDIENAAKSMTGIAVETPFLENDECNANLGGRLLIKAETIQRTGSFKFRGAYYRIHTLNADEKARGVIAYSSGNHAQAVALAAKLNGTQALIVMPKDTPQSKIEGTRQLGASIVTYDRTREIREEIAATLADQRNMVLVPPNEDRRVLAGAGTVGLELIRQAFARSIKLDAILVPCGGGGLTAATALISKALSPSTQVFAVEPEMFDDTARSFHAGQRLTNPKGRSSICDAILTDTPGELTFSINKDLLTDVLTVSDDDVQEAMAYAFHHHKLVIEPGGAVALAAILRQKLNITDKNIAVIATGGNVDTERYCKAIQMK